MHLDENLEEWPPLTPLLNAALDVVWKDRTRSEIVRLWAWVARKSLGNWSPYAVEGRADARFPDYISTPENVALVLGPGPCPMCGRHAKAKTGMPEDFRWHERCMLMAYGVDAAKFGGRAELAWSMEALKVFNAELDALTSGSVQ